MRNATKHPVLSLLAAAGLLVAAGTVAAQGGAPGGAPQEGAPQGGAPQGGAQGAPAPQQQEHVDVSDEQVSSFVEAYMAVQSVNQEYTQRLQAVEDPQEATEMQQEAQGEMESAVTDSGLSVEEYQQIANQAGQDEELRGKIEEELSAHVE